jgi:MFS family permease
VAKLAAGRIVDAMFQRGYRDAQLRWYGICLLIALPIGLFATLSGSAWAFVVAIAIFMTLIGAFQACSFTALNLITPNNLRGTGIAVFTTISGLVGGGIGPVLIPWAASMGGESAIGVGLAAMMSVCCPLGALCLLAALKSMREAMADAERSAAA